MRLQNNYNEGEKAQIKKKKSTSSTKQKKETAMKEYTGSGEDNKWKERSICKCLKWRHPKKARSQDGEIPSRILQTINIESEI